MASKFFALIGQDTVWGIGSDRESCIAEARQWCSFSDEDWERLAEDGRTGDIRMSDTFRIVECSAEFAAKVQAEGGQGLRWFEDDRGVLQLRD